MNTEIYIIMFFGAIILILLFVILSQKSHMRNLKDYYNGEIDRADRQIHNQNIENEIITEKYETTQNALNSVEQKYYKLMRSYLIARKKDEYEGIVEIERAINDDYEALGSKNIPITNYISSAMADFYTLKIKEIENELEWMGQKHRSNKIEEVRNEARQVVERAKASQYAYEYALKNILQNIPGAKQYYILNNYGILLGDSYSEIEKSKQNKFFFSEENVGLKHLQDRATIEHLNKINKLEDKCKRLEEKINEYYSYKDIRWAMLKESVKDYQKEYSSNLTAIPYMSRLVADIMTLDLDRIALSLTWGNNQERKKKVASINALKKEKKEEIEKIKGAEYQLAYLLELYPALQNIIDAEFKELEISYEDISESDPVRHYLEKEDWEKLSETERNQLALDRYVESRRKSKWQIGRDYELFCGYCYERKGYSVDYFGSYNGLEDLGRDLIISKGGKTRIIQCKYWSKNKEIHENHIMQLYGSVIEYNLENQEKAEGILVTNTVLSEKAKEFANVLGITYKENFQIGEFPRIKCNIGVGEFGEKTKIYHLPFDQQYDSTKIDSPGEFMAMTVAEAENAGFRRAYRWHNKSESGTK